MTVTGSCKKLVVFSDDWGKHPSSCQHLIRHLLTTCEVTWINTIGTRPPRLDLTTLVRGLEKIRQWARNEYTRNSDEEQASPRILNPLMWPGFGSSWSRRLNRQLLSRQMRHAIVGLEDAVVLTTIPIVADLVQAVPARRWVYYCVDDFAAWPGLDSQSLQQTEELLVARCDRLVAAGENLARRLQQMGRRPKILTHGVNLAWWQRGSSVRCPQILVTMERPIVLFWGLIDRRLDTAWLEALNRRLDHGSIVLAGPCQEPDPALNQLPRLRQIGQIPFEQLPDLAASTDALIMPYADLPVTRAMQPLKLKEYLATGKPVVTSRLPAVIEWGDCLDVADDAEGFAEVVIERCISGLPPPQLAARSRLARETWSVKAEILREILFERD